MKWVRNSWSLPILSDNLRRTEVREEGGGEQEEERRKGGE